jgi:uncharacterized protein YwqG
MVSEDMKESILGKLEGVKKTAWVPQVEEGDGNITASKFSGRPYLLEGEDYPTCPKCGKPFQLFLQLNISELPEDFREEIGMEEGLIQMFYCTTWEDEHQCEIDWESYFPFTPAQFVRLVIPEGKGQKVEVPEIEGYLKPKVIVGWEEKVDYPGWEEREEVGVELTDEDDDAIYDMEIVYAGDKLGGWPYWVQGVEYPECPECGKTMRLIFQLGSNDNLDYQWGDMGVGHITQCEDHNDKLAFGWACY